MRTSDRPVSGAGLGVRCITAGDDPRRGPCANGRGWRILRGDATARAQPDRVRAAAVAGPRRPPVAPLTSGAERRTDPVVIAGGGIGGLAAALALHRRGVGCRVLEAAQELRPLGVGINLLPSAARVMAELGLLDRLLDGAVETGELIYVNRLGQRIWREPRGRAAGYDYPQVSCHRGRLQLLLLEAVRERLGPDAVETGRR